jgi:hypothetical protein
MDYDHVAAALLAVTAILMLVAGCWVEFRKPGA